MISGQESIASAKAGTEKKVIKNGLFALAATYEDPQPIVVMKGSVLGSRNESGERIRNYRNQNRSSGKDDSSEDSDAGNGNQDSQTKEQAAVVIEQTKEPECEESR